MNQLASIDQMDVAQLQLLQAQIFNRQQSILFQRVEQLEDRNAKLEAIVEIREQQIQTLEHRIDNIDCTNIDGDLRDRFNKMIRLYATKKGIQFNTAYRDFTQAYNMAYKTNLELRITNYCKDHSTKSISTPEYLERSGRLEDAIRVADKMINSIRRGA